jgi:opacity protein-like surface antigen
MEQSKGMFHRLGMGRCGFALAAAVVLFGITPVAFAQPDRAQTYEFGIQVADIAGGFVNGTRGASLDFANDTAIGIVGGYNISQNFQVGGEIFWADPGYSARLPLDPGATVVRVEGDMDVTSFLLKATWNILDTAITPYIEGGAGWMFVDSNVISGLPTTGCWWDPWWGYMCTSFYDTYSDTRTGYTYAAGVRWDMGDAMVLRASYGVVQMDTNNAASDIDLDTLRVEFAWKF